jgi:hypothetical protein
MSHNCLKCEAKGWIMPLGGMRKPCDECNGKGYHGLAPGVYNANRQVILAKRRKKKALKRQFKDRYVDTLDELRQKIRERNTNTSQKESSTISIQASDVSV